jgi:RNA polymerase sigma-70 factor (ECF subfamily)
MVNDARLVQRLQQGDLEALGALYDRHRLTVYRTALAITRDEAAADDILQEAFLRLYSSIARVDPLRPLLPWLYRITVNLSYTWNSRLARWRAPFDEFVEQIIGPAHTNPEPEVERLTDERLLNRALQNLPINQRVVIVLHYLNDLSLPEISEIVNCPVGTLKSRLFYAREALRRQLARDMGDAPPASEVGYEFT